MVLSELKHPHMRSELISSLRSFIAVANADDLSEKARQDADIGSAWILNDLDLDDQPEKYIGSFLTSDKELQIVRSVYYILLNLLEQDDEFFLTADALSINRDVLVRSLFKESSTAIEALNYT